MKTRAICRVSSFGCTKTNDCCLPAASRQYRGPRVSPAQPAAEYFSATPKTSCASGQPASAPGQRQTFLLRAAEDDADFLTVWPRHCPSKRTLHLSSRISEISPRLSTSHSPSVFLFFALDSDNSFVPTFAFNSLSDLNTLAFTDMMLSFRVFSLKTSTVASPARS